MRRILARGRKRKASGRRQAERMFPIYETDICNICGTNKNLQRHHKDFNPMNNFVSNIEILCHKCHVALHVAAGNYGRQQQKNKKKK